LRIASTNLPWARMMGYRKDGADLPFWRLSQQGEAALAQLAPMRDLTEIRILTLSADETPLSGAEGANSCLGPHPERLPRRISRGFGASSK